MKRLHGLLLSLLIASSLSAKTHTEKTFLLAQPMRMPFQHTFYDFTRDLMEESRTVQRDGDELWGGHLQVTGFYREDDNKRDIGRYFGRNGKNVVEIGEEQTNFDTSKLVHNPADSDSLKLKGRIGLSPDRKIYGAHFSYLQKLTPLSDRLFFQVYSPLIQASYRMNAGIYDEKKATINGEEKGIADYFSGNLEQTAESNKQEALKYAKIKPCMSIDETRFADVECLLGYQFGKSDQYYLVSSVGAVIPTGNKPTAEYVFEPIIGHAQQWGIATNLEAMAVLYEKDNTTVDVTCAYNFKYYFSNTQKRTIGFRSSDWDKVRAWSQYDMLAKDGEKGVFPAANVLTQDVAVDQGVEFDCYANLNIHHHDWMFSLGYNCYSREEETVNVKCWDDNTYARVGAEYDATTAFNASDLGGDALDTPIQRESLNPSVAATPALISHKVYGLIAYTWDSIPVPVSIGIGGAYEFTQDNAALEGYELYVKVGLSI